MIVLPVQMLPVQIFPFRLFAKKDLEDFDGSTTTFSSPYSSSVTCSPFNSLSVAGEREPRERHGFPVSVFFRTPS